jgi:haloalkane dehalogenase
VAPDASGPPAIDWALAHPDRAAGLVLLNTSSCLIPTLRAPEAVLPFALPLVRAAASWAVARSDALDRRLFAWQVGRFVRDAAVRAA